MDQHNWFPLQKYFCLHPFRVFSFTGELHGTSFGGDPSDEAGEFGLDPGHLAFSIIAYISLAKLLNWTSTSLNKKYSYNVEVNNNFSTYFVKFSIDFNDFKRHSSFNSGFITMVTFTMKNLSCRMFLSWSIWTSSKLKFIALK